MQGTTKVRLKKPIANRIEPKRTLKSRTRRPQSQAAGKNSAITTSLLCSGFLLGSGLFLGFAMDRSETSQAVAPAASEVVAQAPKNQKSSPKNLDRNQASDSRESQVDDREVDTVLEKAASQIASNDFRDALLQLEDISEKKHSPAQREQFRMLEQKARDGQAMLSELRRRIKAAPGQLVELFEGRFRKIQDAGDRGIHFSRADLPNARIRSMAWNQVSPRGLAALVLAYKLDHRYEEELRVYLADHRLVRSGQTIRTVEEDRKHREALARKKDDCKEVIASLPASEEKPAPSIRPIRYDEGRELATAEKKQDELAARTPSPEKPAGPVLVPEKNEENEVAVQPRKKELRKKTSNPKRKGLVYFRGKWITIEKKRYLDDMVISIEEANTRTFSSQRIQISKPNNDKWSFGSARTDSEIFRLEKRDKGEVRIQITSHFYYFNRYYLFPGQQKTGGDNPSGLLKRHCTSIQNEFPRMRVRKKMRKDLFHKDMHPFRIVLGDDKGRMIEILSVPSNQKNADRSFVFIVDYSPGEYKYARLGIESIMKSFRATGRGEKSWAPGNKPKKYQRRDGVLYQRNGTRYRPVGR